MHLNSLLLFKKYATAYLTDNISILEIGSSGNSDFEKYSKEKYKLNWNTLELKSSPNNMSGNPNHYETSDEYNYPFANESYDIVFSAQVIEHVGKPWIFLKELKRITKPNGYIITINPVSWPYHEDPVDCWRLYPEAFKSLAEASNLQLVLSIWENLEWEYFNFKKEYLSIPNFVIQGKSLAGRNNKVYSFNKQKYYYNSILRLIPFFRRFMASIQISYDTISILKNEN
jgi:SAM-dependent methyltransferase